jgi:hypothetical protein
MEIDQEAVFGMDVSLQGGEPGDDEELVVFPGQADSGTIADFERVIRFEAEAPGRWLGC